MVHGAVVGTFLPWEQRPPLWRTPQSAVLGGDVLGGPPANLEARAGDRNFRPNIEGPKWGRNGTEIGPKSDRNCGGWDRIVDRIIYCELTSY